MLEFVHVDKTYKNKVCALNDCNFKIEQGEFVFLIGPSGAGKSTITKLILKEINPDRGKIYLYGEDITRLKARKVPKLRQSIGMVFQDFKLLENKTVYQNIKYVMQILGKSSSEIKSTIDTVLDLVNLKDKKNAYPHELSGGEMQRVCIARSMVNKPKLLIADEPTGNLDPVTSMDIANALVRINERGTTVMMITHEKDIVNKLQKRVIQLDKGIIVRDEEGGMYEKN
ncbi:MAG: cell division ATP-binding protein FtsE [Finegoldia magna]|uniref:Cell division ATP-binding protein FtsE n=2 Tax=Finegoldia magna TaxID=1260 RepID=A0A233VQ56_FINMA|nr:MULTISPECIES: cell division ATP-binding protein FtsE [Finegoldia]EFK94587.1 putative cell division ATP-binding protein FtsE [Finegoldia magna ACS-171-V-Col3]EFL54483.1 putative cell division ATP-binding protein FtsE [Finegoldia magna BVS033A4]MBS5776732.1 cell division ATP-binding protein FtsE [Finegoldia magna]MBS5942016.1 cell division ATP-binding protein FtsE [Finegoldia magna]MBS5966223.1 cell division ATP-binding protein FtsE [Finegoldia magna]